jgi:hypothetical protein
MLKMQTVTTWKWKAKDKLPFFLMYWRNLIQEEHVYHRINKNLYNIYATAGLILQCINYLA